MSVRFMKVCPRCSKLQPDEVRKCPKDGAELRPVVDPLIGKTVGGRHRLLSRLGVGGMSSVYLARHVLIDRLMAIKTLRRDLAQDPVQRDRFLREARAVNRINHENIVEITDFGETEDGLVYLVMEYVPGEPLLKVLTQAPFATQRVLHIAEQVGNALGRAHQMGVIHRDLKPENILIVSRGPQIDFVKILDFGIAKILDAPSLTGSQQIFGTPGYIAPEYIQSTDIDGRADLYSLGIIMYEMVTGALPFDYEYPGDLLVKHVTEKPIPPRQRHPGVEVPVEDLILRCLRKDPADRFRDAYHFLEELEVTRQRLSRKEPLARSTTRDTLVDQPGPSGTFMPSDPPRPPSDTTPEERESVEPAGDAESQREAKGTPRSKRRREHTPRPLPRASTENGLLGVYRWRKRFDAIRAALDDIEIDLSAPPDIAHAMAFAARTLEDFESGVEQCETHQREIEELSERARQLRASLGEDIDDLARQLSQSRGEFERIVAQRNILRDKREGAMGKSKIDSSKEGSAEALLWELASLEEKLTEKASECDSLEASLAELRSQLEVRNEEFEKELARLIHDVDHEMMRLEPIAFALREPLDATEAFVRACWNDQAFRKAAAQPEEVVANVSSGKAARDESREG